jgi:hypothetical protein
MLSGVPDEVFAGRLEEAAYKIFNGERLTCSFRFPILEKAVEKCPDARRTKF